MPINEVGEADGRPLLALKYVAGGIRRWKGVWANGCLPRSWSRAWRLAIEQEEDTSRDGEPRQDLAAAGETDSWDQMQSSRRDEPAAEQDNTQARLALKEPHAEPPIPDSPGDRAHPVLFGCWDLPDVLLV